MRILGIDEAGRGPVIGPMVMAGVAVTETQDDELRILGVKDSKLLTPAQRVKLAHAIEESYDHFIIELSPKEIDEAVDGPSMNLNLLEARTSAMIIAKLMPDKALLDCPSNNIEAYVRAVKRFLPEEAKNVTIIAEHKADAKYPPASAASIIAKVRRDSRIDEIKAEVGEIGSGYPSDPVTQEFLKNNYDKYEFFRKSWSSWKTVAEKKNQRSLVDF